MISGLELKLSYADLSLSQLDPGVMAALPEDIQREVQMHFDAKVKASPVKTAFDEMKISALVSHFSLYWGSKNNGDPNIQLFKSGIQIDESNPILEWSVT